MAPVKAVLVLGVSSVVALVFSVLCVINIALYASAMNQDADLSSSLNCKYPCRERTGTIGVVAGSLGLVLAATTVGLLAMGLFESTTRGMNLLAKGVLLGLIFIVGVFQLTAWALMAKDINSFNNAFSYACDISPHLWNAALAFGLFAFLAVGFLFVVVMVGLVLDFMLETDTGGSTYGRSSGDGEAASAGRGHSYYGEHVSQYRAEQQPQQQHTDEQQQQQVPAGDHGQLEHYQ